MVSKKPKLQKTHITTRKIRAVVKKLRAMTDEKFEEYLKEVNAGRGIRGDREVFRWLNKHTI